MRAKGKSISWRKSKIFPSFLGYLNYLAINTRTTWRNLHLGHLFALALFFIGLTVFLIQAKPFETLAANHTLRINTGKISGTGNIFNVKIVDKSLLDTQPAGTNPNNLATFGTYGGLTSTVSGSNSLYTISSLTDLTNYSFKLVAPLSATADTTYKFYDWQGCNNVEDNYKADWTPGQDEIFETCLVTYNTDQSSFTRDITVRFAAPNSVSILTTGTGIAVYQQQNVKVIDKAYYDTLLPGTDPNSLSTYGTYGGLTSAAFYTPNGAYNYSFTVPADQRYVSLVFPTYHPGSDSYIWDLGGACIQEDNYKADWTPGQDGIPETCKIDFGDQYRVGGIARTSATGTYGGYVEVRYTKNTVQATLYSTDNTPLNLNTIKLIEKNYYDTLPSGTNPATLSTYGPGGGVFAANTGTSPFWFSQFTKGIPAKKTLTTLPGNNSGAYTYKAIISQFTDSGKAFEGFVCNGSAGGGAYGTARCEDNYKADWTPGQDGVFETISFPITDTDGGSNYNTDAWFNAPKLRVFTTTNDPFNAGYNILDSVKIYTKSRYDTLYPSAGVNPNTIADVNYGTEGGVTSSNYNTTTYKLEAGYYYSINGTSFSTSLIAPLAATNDTTYSFAYWAGCSSTQDNFTSSWTKTTNNGGGAAPDGIAETCVINFNDGLTHTVRAVYQGNHLTVASTTSDPQNTRALSISNVRVADMSKWTTVFNATSYINLNGYNTSSTIFNTSPTTNAGYLTSVLGNDAYYYTKELAVNTYKISAAPYAADNSGYRFTGWVGCDSTADYMESATSGSMRPTTTSGISGAVGVPDGINETCIINLATGPKKVYVQYSIAQLQVVSRTTNSSDPKFLQIDNARFGDIDQWTVAFNATNNTNLNGYNTTSTIFTTAPSKNAGNITTAPASNGWYYTKELEYGTYRLAANRFAANDTEYTFAGWVGCDSTADYMEYTSNSSMRLTTTSGISGAVGVPDGINETCIINLATSNLKQVVALYNTSLLKVRITTQNPTDVNAGYLTSARFITTAGFLTQYNVSSNGAPNNLGSTSSGLTTAPAYGGITDQQATNGSYYTKYFGSITNGQLSAPPQAYSNTSYTFVGWSGCDSTADYYEYTGGGNMRLTSTSGVNGAVGTPDGINETCFFNIATGNQKEIVAKYQRTTLTIITRTTLAGDTNYLGLDNVKIRDWANSGWVGSYGSTQDPNSYSGTCPAWNNSPDPFSGGSFGGCTSTLDSANGWKYTRGTGSFSKRLYAPYYATNDSEYKFVQWQGCDSVQDNATTAGALGQDGIFETCVIAKSDGNSYTVIALYKRTTLRVYTTTDQPGNGDYSTIDNVKIRDYNNTPNFTSSYTNNNPSSYSGTCTNSDSSLTAASSLGTFGGCTKVDGSPNGWYYERRDGVIQTSLIASLRANADTEYVFAGWSGCESVQDNFDSSWNSNNDGIFETCVLNFSNGLTNSVTAQYRKLDTRIRVTTLVNKSNDPNYSAISNVKIRDYTNTPNFVTSWTNNSPNSYTNGCSASDSVLSASSALGTFGGCTKVDGSPNGWYYERSSALINLNGAISTKLIAPFTSTSSSTYTFVGWTGCTSVEDNFDTNWTTTPDGLFETCVLNLNNGQMNYIQALYRAPTVLNVYASTTLSGDTDYNSGSFVNVKIRDWTNTPNFSSNWGNSNNPNSWNQTCGTYPDTNAQGATQLGAFGGCTKTSSASGYYYQRISVNTNNGNSIYSASITTKLLAPLTVSGATSYYFQNWVGCTSVEDNFNASWTTGQDGVFETCVLNNVSDYNPVTIRALYSRTQISVYTSTQNSTDLNYSTIDNVKIADFVTYNASYVGTNPNNLTNAQLGTLGSPTINQSNNGYYYSYSSNTTVAGRLVAPLVATNDLGFSFTGWTGCNTVQDNYDAAWNKTTNNGGTATPDGIFETCQFSFANNKPNELRAVYGSGSLQVISNTISSSDPNFAQLDNVKIKDIGAGPGVPVTFDPNSYSLLGDLGTYGGVTDTANSLGYQYTRNSNTLSTRLIAPLTATNDPAYRFVGWTGCDATQDNYDTSWNGGTDGRNETCVISVSSNVVKQVKAQYRKETTDIRIVSRSAQASDSNYSNIDNVQIISTDIYSSYSNRDPNSFSLATGFGQFGGVTNTSDVNGYYYSKSSGVLNPITTKFVAPITLPNHPDYYFVSWAGCDTVEDNYNATWNALQDGTNETCVFNHNDGLSYTLVAQYQKTTLNVYTSTVNTADTNYNGIDGVKIVSGDAIGFGETRDGNGRFGKTFILTNQSPQPIINYIGSFTFNSQSLVTAGKMRSDCGDIRLFNGASPVQHDIANCNSTSSTLYFKIPSLANGSTTINFKYGNLGDTNIATSAARWQVQDFTSITTAPTCTLTGNLTWDNTNKQLISPANSNGGACSYSNTNGNTFIAEYDWAAASGNTGYAGLFFGGSSTMESGNGDINALPVNTYYIRTFNAGNSLEVLKKTGATYASLSTATLSGTGDGTYRKVRVELTTTTLKVYINGALLMNYSITYIPFGNAYGLYGTNYGVRDAAYYKNFQIKFDTSIVTTSGLSQLNAPTVTNPAISASGNFGGLTSIAAYPLGYTYSKNSNYIVTTLFPSLYATNDSDYIFDSWMGCDTTEDNYKTDWTAGQDGIFETCYTNKTQGETSSITARYRFAASKIEIYTSTTSSSDGMYNSIDRVKIVSDNAFGNYPQSGGITYSNSGSTLTNIWLYTQLDTTSLISSGKMRSDCGDIRVFDTNNTTQLQYDVASCNTISTRVYFKVPSLSSGSSTFFLRYGNLNDTSARTAFVDINDLTTATTTPFCTILGAGATPTWDNANKYLRLSTATNNVGGNCYYDLGRSADIDMTFEGRAGGGNGATGIYIAFGGANELGSSSADSYQVHFNEYSGLHGGNTIELNRQSGGAGTNLTYASVPLDLDNSTWYTYRIRVDTNGNVKVSINGTIYLDYTITSYAPVGNHIGLQAWTGGLNNNHDVRNLIVTRNVDPQPAVLSAQIKPQSPFDPNLANGTTYGYGSYGVITSQTSGVGWFNKVSSTGTVISSRFYAPLTATNDPNYIFSDWMGCDATEDNYKADWTVGTDGVNETCLASSSGITKQIRARYTLGSNSILVYSSGNNPQNPEYNTIDGVKIVSIDAFEQDPKDSNNLYTRRFEVNNPGSTVTNPIIRINIDTSYPILSNTMRSDCGDIRLYQNDEVTPIAFGITQCNSPSTGLFIKPSSLNSGTTRYVVKFGNQSLTSIANNTPYQLPINDLSTGASCTLAGNSTWDSVNNYLVAIPALASQFGTCSYMADIGSQYTATAEFWVNGSSEGSILDRFGFFESAATPLTSGNEAPNTGMVRYYFGTSGGFLIDKVGSTGGSASTAGTFNGGQWRTMKFVRNGNTTQVYIDNVLRLSDTNTIPYTSGKYLGFFARSDGSNNPEIRLRNFSLTGPAVFAPVTFTSYEVTNGTATNGLANGAGCTTAGNSTWDSVNNYLVAIPALASQFGTCNFTGSLGANYEATAEFWVNGSSETSTLDRFGFYAGATSVPTSANETPNAGMVRYYFGTSGGFLIDKVGGTGGTAGTAGTFNGGQWRTMKFVRNGNTTQIYIDNVLRLSDTNTIPASAGTNFGFFARSDTSNNPEIRLRNFLVTSITPLSYVPYNPNSSNGTTIPYGGLGGVTSGASQENGYFYTKGFTAPVFTSKLVAPITATNDPTYSLTGWLGCDSVEDNFTNAWTNGTDGVFETCVISPSYGSSAKTIRAQYASNTTIVNVYSRTLNSSDSNYNQIDNVKIVSNDKYLSTAERNPNNFTDAMGYGDYGNKTSSASASGYFYTKNSFTVNATNTIATQLIAPLTATNDPGYIFDSWSGCDSVQDTYDASWNLGTDGINETCLISFSNGISNNVYALYKRTSMRVVTSTANAANPEYLGVDAVKILDTSYYTTLGAGTDPNTAVTYGTLGGITTNLVSDGYQYTYAAGSISGSLVAPLIATNDPTFKFAGWSGCTSTQDNYTSAWTLGTDGLAETCVINFANGDVNTVRAVYQPPTRVTVNATRPTGSNGIKVISQDAATANGGIFNPALAGTSTYTYGTVGGTASYQYSSYNAITTSLYPEHELNSNEVFINWTGCTSTQDNYKADWTAGQDGINETCVINFSNNSVNTVTANYRAPASLTVDVQKPLAGNAKVVSQSAFTANGSAFDPALAGTSTYTYGAFGGTTQYTTQDGYISTKLYPQLTLSTNEVFDSWTGCDTTENNYGSTWSLVGGDTVNETCVVNLTNATPRTIKAIYKVTTIQVRSSTITPGDSLYGTIDNVKIVDKTYYDTQTAGTDPNTLTSYGNLGGVTNTSSGSGYFYTKNFATITGRLIAPLTATNDPAFDFRDWVGCDSVEDNYKANWTAGTDGLFETCVVNFTNYTTNTIRARYGKTSIKVITRTTAVGDANYTLIDNVKIVDKTYYDTQTAGTDPNTLTSYGTLGNKTTTTSSSGYNYIYKNYTINGKLVAPLTASNDPNYRFISWVGCDSVEDNYDASWNTGTDGKAETCVINFNDGVEHQLIAQYRNIYTSLLVVTKGLSTDSQQYTIDNVKIVDKTYYDTQTAGTDPNTLTSYGTWGGATTSSQAGLGYYYTKQSAPEGSITTRLIAPEQATNDPNHYFNKWIGCDSYEDNYTINWQIQSSPSSVTTSQNSAYETCVINYNNGLSNQITAEYKFIAPPSTIRVYTQTISPSDFGYDSVQNVKIASQGYAGGDPSQYSGAQLGVFGGVTNTAQPSKGFYYTYTNKPIGTKLYPSMIDPTDNYSFRSWSGCDSVEDNYDRNWVQYPSNLGAQFRDQVFETCVINFDDGLEHEITAQYTGTQIRVYSNALYTDDINYSQIDNVKIASQGYAGGDPNNLGAAQLGTYGNSTYLTGGNPARWYYDIGTGAVNTRLYAPLLATNDQTYIFTGWSGCNSVEDNFKGDWTPGGDGIAETCVINRNTQYQIAISANYSQTKIRVFANTYSQNDPRRNNIKGVRIASQGFGGGDPLTIPVQNLGPFGGELTQYVDTHIQPFIGDTYTVAATTINTELYAPLTAPNNVNDPYDDYKFVEWGGNCQSTLDKYDINWVLTTDYGGTATPDGLKETCVVSKNNGLINDIIAIYSGDLVRVNVSSARYSAGSANITGVKILEIPYVGAAPAINDPNTYAINTLGAHGGVTNYQINETTGLQIRLVAPRIATNNPDYEFRDWYWSYGTPCTSVQDNYDANYNLGTDGVFETCVINQNTSATLNIVARYKQSVLTVATGTLSSFDLNYSGIDNVKVASQGYAGGDPNQYSSAQLGTYGGVTSTLYQGLWRYSKGLAGSFSTRLFAPLIATNDPTFNFVRWDNCDSVEDNFDGIWNNGTDGRFETCVIAANDGQEHTVTARYSDQVTRLQVYSGTENNGSTSTFGITTVRDIGIGGNPGPDHDPYLYNPSNLPGLGTIGGITNQNDGSKYQRDVAGPGNMVNGTINTRLVASWKMIHDTTWKFWKWSGCDSTQDLYDKEFNYGVTDGIAETCVFNRSNGQMNRIYAIYQQKTLVVHTSTASGFDTDFSDIDNVKILEYGWGNPALPSVSNPNNLSQSSLGTFGGITDTPYYYYAYNKSDWSYSRREGYIYQTRLLAPLYATNDLDYGFSNWSGCDSVEDNFNALWQPGTDGKAETCVIELITAGNSTKHISAIYDDAKSNLTVASNIGAVPITSPDADWNGFNTPRSKLKVGIDTSFRVPHYITVSATQVRVFNSWTGCNSTQDNYLSDGTTLGQDGVNETCLKSLPDATSATVTANYTVYNYGWGAPHLDQPAIAVGATGITITSDVFAENGTPLAPGQTCENRLQYIEPTVGTLHTYTSTTNNLSKCVTTVPVGDIATVGRFEISSRIPNWRGVSYLSSTFAPNPKHYIVDSGLYTNTLYAYYDAGHPGTNNTNTINDLSNRGNNGSNNNASLNTNGVARWSFNGSTSFIRSSLPSNFATDVTFEVWYKRASTNRGALVTQYRFNDTINRLALTNNNDTLSATANLGQDINHDSVFISGDYWQMGTLTYNTGDNQIKIYANGVLQSQFSDGTLFAPSSYGIDIGKSVLSDYFQGDIAEVRLYNSALPEVNIRQNFEAQKAKYSFTQAATNIKNLPLSLHFGSYGFSVDSQTTTRTISGASFLDRRAQSSAWNATISSTPFTSANGSVNAENIGISHTADPARTMGSPKYVTYSADGNLPGNNQPKTLINVSQFNGTGEYPINHDINLTIPGYTPPGSYTATITVTTTSY